MTPAPRAAHDNYRHLVGKSQNYTQRLEAENLRRFALAVGAKFTRAPLAHWAFFLPGPTDGEIGADGHDNLGGFLSDIPLPRRMFAGSSIQFHAQLEIGEMAELTTTLMDITPKSGRSGELVFVEVDRVLSQSGIPRVTERRSYVCRKQESGPPTSMPIPAANLPDGEEWMPTEANLFRFSAATFNSHRIHYDQAYTTSVERYPALLIQGPFTAAKLAGLAMRNGDLATFSFRAKAPLFVGQPVFLASPAEDEVTAIRCDGVSAMISRFTLR